VEDETTPPALRPTRHDNADKVGTPALMPHAISITSTPPRTEQWDLAVHWILDGEHRESSSSTMLCELVELIQTPHDIR